MMARLAKAIPVLLLVLCGPLPWGATAVGEGMPSAVERGAIRQVIEGQIAAFQRGDGNAAFAYASPGIQAKFGDPETFMKMVETGYAPVYRPREVEFRDIEMHGGTPIQKVLVVGPDGQPVMALYAMERQPDGSWRISGCTLVKAPDETV
jgi:hypothetical protein